MTSPAFLPQVTMLDAILGAEGRSLELELARRAGHIDESVGNRHRTVFDQDVATSGSTDSTELNPSKPERPHGPARVVLQLNTLLSEEEKRLQEQLQEFEETFYADVHTLGAEPELDRERRRYEAQIQLLKQDHEDRLGKLASHIKEEVQSAHSEWTEQNITLTSKVAQLEEEKADLETRLVDATQEIFKLSAEKDMWLKHKESTDRIISELLDKEAEAKKVATLHEQDNKTLASRIAELERANAIAMQEVSTAQQASNSSSFDRERLMALITQQRDKIQSMEGSFTAEEHTKVVEELTSELHALRCEVGEQQGIVHELTSQLLQSVDKAQAAEREIQSLQGDREKVKEDRDKLQEDRDKLQAQLEQSQAPSTPRPAHREHRLQASLATATTRLSALATDIATVRVTAVRLAARAMQRHVTAAVLWQWAGVLARRRRLHTLSCHVTNLKLRGMCTWALGLWYGGVVWYRRERLRTAVVKQHMVKVFTQPALQAWWALTLQARKHVQKLRWLHGHSRQRVSQRIFAVWSRMARTGLRVARERTERKGLVAGERAVTAWRMQTAQTAQTVAVSALHRHQRRLHLAWRALHGWGDVSAEARSLLLRSEVVATRSMLMLRRRAVRAWSRRATALAAARTSTEARVADAVTARLQRVWGVWCLRREVGEGRADLILSSCALARRRAAQLQILRCLHAWKHASRRHRVLTRIRFSALYQRNVRTCGAALAAWVAAVSLSHRRGRAEDKGRRTHRDALRRLLGRWREESNGGNGRRSLIACERLLVRNRRGHDLSRLFAAWRRRRTCKAAAARAAAGAGRRVVGHVFSGWQGLALRRAGWSSPGASENGGGVSVNRVDASISGSKTPENGGSGAGEGVAVLSFQSFLSAMLARLEEAYPHDRPSDNLRAVVDLWREMRPEDRAKWQPQPNAETVTPKMEEAIPKMEAVTPKMDTECPDPAFYESVISGVVAELGFMREEEGRGGGDVGGSGS